MIRRAAEVPMYFERFYLGCLAHASYMFGSEGQAVVVDPQRDVEIYLDAATRNQLAIRYIFETHLHADFVSGHKELAQRTGATICMGAAAGATFPHTGMTDGFELKVGSVLIKGFETPGHTPESICLVLTDLEKSSEPWAVLTGDTLFLGDVGRPDLSRTHTAQQLAGMMFDSLHQKLLTLPDSVLVYPAHGAGSLCGRKISSADSSTIGTERLTNYALQIKTRDEFITQMTANLPSRPEYFAQDAAINREGAAALDELAELPAISPADLKTMIEQGATALDVREGGQFAAGHVPGSVNIALGGQFASWTAIVLGLDSQPVLIGESPDQVDEARLRLARVGVESLIGYLDGGIGSWTNAGFALETTSQITVDELNARLQDGALRVLDVRRDAEWEAGHVPRASLHPLDRFHASLPLVDTDKPLAVHCKSGYRSMIACSLLQKAGHQNVINVVGGFDAWQQTQLPVATSAAVGGLKPQSS
jgi:glyoxylase-like metal-dependent hydrolase (beta-lactamase superfamily II)/rhodanese-related sulfurtransferase